MTRHHCGMPALVGLDGDRCGLVTLVDPYPLTALGEVAALRADRATYSLDSGRLYRRDRWSIPGRPPSHELVVLATHDCTRIPDDWRLPPAPPKPPRIEEPW
jgi:hypothetical protein